MKECFRCHAVKPLGDFYRHPGMADGHLNKCKECTKADVHRDYVAKRAEKAIYDVIRNQRPERKAQRLETQKRSRKRNRMKWSARARLEYAVNRGLVSKKPCEVCGAEKSEGHHPDYSRPLDVRWLCKRHHFAVHGKEART
jgi:hypothetical protein